MLTCTDLSLIALKCIANGNSRCNIVQVNGFFPMWCPKQSWTPSLEMPVVQMLTEMGRGITDYSLCSPNPPSGLWLEPGAGVPEAQRAMLSTASAAKALGAAWAEPPGGWCTENQAGAFLPGRQCGVSSGRGLVRGTYFSLQMKILSLNL